MVEGLSTRQDSHLTAKPGAGQGSPMRVAPLYRAILVVKRGVLLVVAFVCSRRCVQSDLHVDALRLRQRLLDQGALMVAGSWRRWWGLACGWGAGRGGRRLRGPLLRLCTSQRQFPAVLCPRFSSSTVVGYSCCAAELCIHSANCEDDRRDSSGAALSLRKLIQQRGVRSEMSVPEICRLNRAISVSAVPI